MTSTRTGAHTATFRKQYGSWLTDGLTATTQAATAGDFKQATILTGRFTAAAQHLHHSVVRDALAAGLDWWQIGELLTLHPQAAFDAYANLADATYTPARQRPHLAVAAPPAWWPSTTWTPNTASTSSTSIRRQPGHRPHRGAAARGRAAARQRHLDRRQTAR
jgi:hypothetical protein